MFAVTIILMGGVTRLISAAGFFIPAQLIHRYSTPVWSVNAPTAHEVIVNGKGCAVIYYSQNIKFWYMTITGNQNACATGTQRKELITAQTIIDNILSTQPPENIREALHEMMLAYFMHHENLSSEVKDSMYFAYSTLYDALKDIEVLNTEIQSDKTNVEQKNEI